MTKVFLVAAATLLATTVGVAAYTPKKAEIDARQQRQLGAIEQGRQAGDITWREGLKLRAHQRNIARTEAGLAADGYLSKSDRRRLDALQNNARSQIHAESSDRRRRWWWLPRVGR